MKFIDSITLKEGLTVGEVAGLISGGIAIVQNTLPLFIAVIIIGAITSSEQTAATWSVAGRLIQSSLWPTLLGADSTSNKHVNWRVVTLSGLMMISVIVLIVAHFFTPQGLTTTIHPHHKEETVKFKYFGDETFFGQGTPPRADNPINRVCGWVKWKDCPGSTYDDPYVRNQYKGAIVVNSTIPSNLSQIFSSETVGTTIAGPMDIQYRSWYNERYSEVDNNNIRAVGSFHSLQSMVLDDSYQIIEGLVVDSINGGIGFRNHTMPSGLELGATWNEDLLWITPVTACSPTNLSLHFSISNDDFWTTKNGFLRDDGGFNGIASQPPTPIWNGTHPQWNISGPVPDLEHRAYTAAWWNNLFTAMALNISNSSTGKTYTDGLRNYGSLASPSSIRISEMDGEYIDSIFAGSNTTASLIQATIGQLNADEASTLEAAFKALANNTINGNITFGNFTAYGRRCSGFDDTDVSTSSKPYIRCGYVYGVPFPSNAQQPWRFDLGSDWTQQLYTCASSVKASIKTVTFSTNGTETLSSLQVVDVKPKNYANNHSALPLWAVEKVGDKANLTVEDVNLFWGLIDEAYANEPSLITYRAEELFLPVCTQGKLMGYFQDGLAATQAFTAAWNSVYNSAAAIQGTALNFVPSFSGESNLGLTLKWRELSQSPEGISKMLNLIWTDLAAWATVGTKTGFETSTGPTANLRERSETDPTIMGKRSIQRHVRSIAYKDIRYAIPAFVVGGIYAIALIMTIVIGAWKVPWRKLHHYTNATSMGRVVTNVMAQQKREAQLEGNLNGIGTGQAANGDGHVAGEANVDPDETLSTKEWLATYGSRKLYVPAWRRRPKDRTRSRFRRVYAIVHPDHRHPSADQSGLEMGVVGDGGLREEGRRSRSNVDLLQPGEEVH